MSVQLDLKLVYKGVDTDTMYFDINSVDISEVLEYISYRTDDQDENGNCWYYCDAVDYVNAISCEIENAEYKFGDFWDDLHMCKKIIPNYSDEVELEQVKVYWKIS